VSSAVLLHCPLLQKGV